MFASWWQVGHHLMEAPVPGRTTKQRAAETKRHFSKHETVISLLKHKNIFPPHFPTALTRPGLFMCVERHQLAAVHRELCRDDGRAAARSFDADVKRRVATGMGRRLPGCWRRFVSDARVRPMTNQSTRGKVWWRHLTCHSSKLEQRPRPSVESMVVVW